MNLGRQIHTLLKRQTSVYVNRLGVFKRVHTPATFDAKRHVFLPPITFIEFDSVATDGYDFVTYVQQANQLDRHEAELLVEQSVATVLDKLNQSGQVSLDNLGQLISYGNSYVFKPLDLSGFNYTAVEDNFSADDSSIAKEDVAVETQPATAVTDDSKTSELLSEEISDDVVKSEPGVALENMPDSVEAETNILTESDAQNDLLPSNERKSTSAYVYALVGIIAVVLLGGLYYYSTYMQQGPVVETEEQVMVPLDSTLTDTLVADLSVDSTLITQDSVASSSDLQPDQEKSEEITSPPVNHRYTIVIGTHRTLAQAYEEAEAFNKDGHKSVRVITPNLAKNLKRVVWDTYASKEERDSALLYVKKHIKTDAWPDVIK
ncbi:MULTISPECIES: hypothetical protein [Sphingobacterium]|uniref:hypothetical protein n=1 Tax=Sphingobacterium TaxID=28453 RepID=UPI0013D938C4|nr:MULTISPECIES: hypothetical protein [unclassified Sphingobacterium]